MVAVNALWSIRNAVDAPWIVTIGAALAVDMVNPVIRTDVPATASMSMALSLAMLPTISITERPAPAPCNVRDFDPIARIGTFAAGIVHEHAPGGTTTTSPFAATVRA